MSAVTPPVATASDPATPSSTAAAGSPGTPSAPVGLPAAQAPRGMPLCYLAGLLLALATIALGAIAIRDAAIRLGPASGTEWTRWVADKAQVLVPADWMWWAGPLAFLVGLVLLVAAVRPRPRRYRQVSEHVWVAQDQVARLEGEAGAS